MLQILRLSIQFWNWVRTIRLSLQIDKNSYQRELLRVAEHRRYSEPWFFEHRVAQYLRCSSFCDFCYPGRFSWPFECRYLKKGRKCSSNAIKIIQNLTKLNKRVRSGHCVDFVAELIVKLLWQVLQKGVGQLLVEIFITQGQKTGILLNDVAKTRKIKK